MARDAAPLTETHVATNNADTHPDIGTAERFDGGFAAAFARRGIDVDSLSASELSELGAHVWERLSPVIDEVVGCWQDDEGTLGALAEIDRELRRRIVAEHSCYDTDYECEGCGYRHSSRENFSAFHDLFLCHGCVENARHVLRDLQRPLIEALEAEPTLERARALGFELIEQGNGRLVWVSDDGDYDGGAQRYADAQDALANLVGELA